MLQLSVEVVVADTFDVETWAFCLRFYLNLKREIWLHKGIGLLGVVRDCCVGGVFLEFLFARQVSHPLHDIEKKRLEKATCAIELAESRAVLPAQAHFMYELRCLGIPVTIVNLTILNPTGVYHPMPIKPVVPSCLRGQMWITAISQEYPVYV